jgi:putative RecB family exonuclease
MSWRDYDILKGKIEEKSEPLTKNKYGITSDILSFQLCRRQYGFFAVRGYQPAHVEIGRAHV